jgi:hypothetical protein
MRSPDGRYQLLETTPRKQESEDRGGSMIPDRLEQVVTHFTELCRADARIVAAFVGGSLAIGTADAYSDLDLYLITAEDGYASFFAERGTFVRQMGDPVYLEDFNGFGFDMVLFIFANGSKGELALAKASRFLHIHGGPYCVLVDKAGLLLGVTFPVDQVSPEKQRHNLERTLTSFWRYVYLLAGALGRGRLLTAAQYLEGMRQRLIEVCRMSVDFSDGGSHPPAEVVLPPDVIAALRRTYPRLNREEMMAAGEDALRLLQRVGKPLAQAQGVTYPEALEQVVLAYCGL